jgi:hypothetical protein
VKPKVRWFLKFFVNGCEKIEWDDDEELAYERLARREKDAKIDSPIMLYKAELITCSYK